MRKYRLYGSIKDIKKTGSNSTCDYYSLTLYIKWHGDLWEIQKESGFNGYTKREIFKKLKTMIINELKTKYEMETY